MNDGLKNALTLLAQAYAFAKDGNADAAGKLFVKAAADDQLDEVMDGVAQAADAVDGDADDFEDMPDDLDEGDGEDEEEAPAEDDAQDAPESTEIEANVKLPESVARLAARTLV